MNVYIGTSGTLKNAYIGEVYEYSYDFRGKSSTILTNDGWTTSGLSYDNNGIYMGSRGSIYKSIGTDLTNAKKITLTAGLYNAKSFISWYGLYPSSSSSTGRTGVFIAGDGYGDSGIDINATGVQSWTQSRPSGQSEWNITYDFNNLTYNFVYAGVTKSGTFTQSDANIIRGLKYFRIALQYTGGRMQYIKLLVK